MPDVLDDLPQEGHSLGLELTVDASGSLYAVPTDEQPHQVSLRIGRDVTADELRRALTTLIRRLAGSQWWWSRSS